MGPRCGGGVVKGWMVGLGWVYCMLIFVVTWFNWMVGR